MKTPKHIQHWDDERSIGNGIIVTLRFGFSFENKRHLGVKGFDSIRDAILGTRIKHIYVCDCLQCKGKD